jgi:hypothetical protein
MIPREILKKIRQIELRTNRIVTELTAGARLCKQQHLLLSPSMENSVCTRFGEAVVGRRSSCSAWWFVGALEMADVLRLLLGTQPRSGLSLTPGFSPVIGDGESFNRFNGFPRTEKPLKRLGFVRRVHTGLKPGVNESSLKTASFKPSLQFHRIARGVKNGEHGEGIILDREVDGVFLESSEANLLCASTNRLKMPRVGQCSFESQLHLQFEFAPESGTLSFIPSNGFFKLQTGSGFENDRKTHFQPKRLLRSASTCSQGIPSWGFFSKSAKRRSSSAT